MLVERPKLGMISAPVQTPSIQSFVTGQFIASQLDRCQALNTNRVVIISSVARIHVLAYYGSGSKMVSLSTYTVRTCMHAGMQKSASSNTSGMWKLLLTMRPFIQWLVSCQGLS